MPIATKRKFAGALALTLSLALGACGGMPTNPSLSSLKQPVVERTNYTFDVQASGGGLTIPEQQRLSAWFEALQLGYGDRLSIEDPMMSPATREAIAKLAARHGVLLSDGAPLTAGYIEPGAARVVVTRSSASVPGCPDWSASSDMNFDNGTSPGYGCATNGNLAAMVANPEDLIAGQNGSGTTTVSTSNKAIGSYREQAPTGEGGLKAAATNSGGGN
jgi:pilus assembly protein CpaD